MLEEELYKDLLSWVEEDAPFWDLTSMLVDEKRCVAKIVAKTQVYVCNTKLLEKALSKFGVRAKFKEGWVKGELATLEGEARTLLTLERTLLNFLMHVFAITTEGRRLAERANGVKVAITRKTLPCLRRWDKYFASCSGLDTHRLSLSDAYLIKDNHLAIEGFEIVKKALNEKSFIHKVEVEVNNLEDAVKAAKLGVDAILIDNLPPEEAKMIACEVKKIGNVTVEVSGGITLDNIKDYLSPCIDVISVGYVTLFPPKVDLSMKVIECGWEL